jgi:uncharacterized UPF0160 family protein
LCNNVPVFFRYDHHQKSFTESMSSLDKGPWTTKLSSAGLVYAFYGKQVIESLAPPSHNENLVDRVFAKVGRARGQC